LDYPKEYRVPGRSFDSEQDLVYSLKRRNQVLDDVFKKIEYGHNSLILVNKIDHLKEVIKYCERIFPEHKIHEIYGETEAIERERIRQLIDEDDKIKIWFDDRYILVSKNTEVPLTNGTTKLAKQITKLDDINEVWIEEIYESQRRI
jgi:hypothetical protein